MKYIGNKDVLSSRSILKEYTAANSTSLSSAGSYTFYANVEFVDENLSWLTWLVYFDALGTGKWVFGIKVNDGITRTLTLSGGSISLTDNTSFSGDTRTLPQTYTGTLAVANSTVTLNGDGTEVFVFDATAIAGTSWQFRGGIYGTAPALDVQITWSNPIYYTEEYASVVENTPDELSTSRLITSGDVGINTSTPAYDLDVSGDINYTGDLRKNGTIQVFAPRGMEYRTDGYVNTTSRTGYLDLGTTLMISVNTPHKLFISIGGTGSIGNEIKLAFNYGGFGTRGLSGWCKYTNLSGTDTFVAKNTWNSSYTTEYMTMGTSRNFSSDATHIDIDVTSGSSNVMAFSGKFVHSANSQNNLSTFESGDFGYQSSGGTYGSYISRVYYDLGSTPTSGVNIYVRAWRYIQ